MEQSTSRETITTHLYKHTLRPDWGHALPIWKRDDKQAFQFEDGKVRIFKRDYWNLLAKIDVAADKTAETLARLGQSEANTQVASSKLIDGALPFGAQLLQFADAYPRGFAGAKWRKAKRGFDAKRRLKRHRDPLLKEASEFFRTGHLAALLRDGKYDAAFQGFLKLMQGTDLATPSLTKKLAGLSEQAQKRLVFALAAMVHGEEVFAIRFERWVTELRSIMRKMPTWPLVSTPLALARPSEWVSVRPARFAQQARWMAPNLASDRTISAQNYERWNAMACAIADELKAAGLAPRDHLDVYDFIAETLKPKNMEKARSLYQATRDEASSDAGDALAELG